jgi:hypothetical protein
MSEIIERVLGYSDKNMVDYCDLLIKTMTSTTEKIVKEKGVEKKVLVKKYKDDDGVLDRLEKSRDYYQKLITDSMGDAKIELRDYQVDISNRATECLTMNRFVYLAMEVRTGKTLTSLQVADNCNAKEVLFVTKKKAISSIENDYGMLKPSFEITVINYESLHLVKDTKKWDFLIVDEAHSLGAFPKPSSRAVMVKDIIRAYNPMVVFLSGTPTPESYSQMYHQVYGLYNNPFKHCINFYKFSAEYVDVKQKKVNGMFIRDYSFGRDSILESMKPYTISYTQKEAGYVTNIQEEILYCSLKPSTYNMIKRLKNDLVIEGKEETILGDTPVKLMSKLHQLYSGTIKFESGNSMIIDTTKAEYIKENFEGCKIGIFYKFKEEYEALKKVFGDEITNDIDDFNNSWKNIALQIVSGREGISLKKADYLVYYNIDFSATSYWQSRDRMTTKERLSNKVYWVFAEGGIEDMIYKAVSNKKDYTVNHFKKDLFSL